MCVGGGVKRVCCEGVLRGCVGGGVKRVCCEGVLRGCVERAYYKVH